MGSSPISSTYYFDSHTIHVLPEFQVVSSEMSGSVELSGGSSGVGLRTFNTVTIQNNYDVEQTLNVELAEGDNVFPVPANAVGVIVSPIGVATTFVLSFRTSQNSSDTGLPLSDLHPLMYVFTATPPTSIIINSNAEMTAGNGQVLIWFW